MNILIVDDHVVVRQGVQRLLSTIPEAHIYEAANAHEALTHVRAEKLDVIVLDINLGSSSGLELLRRLLIERGDVRVVMFSMHAEPMYAVRALKAGAYGYVCKSASSDELATAVIRAAAGERYLDQDIAGDLVLNTVGEDPLEKLTNREIEILRLLGEGKSLSGIAETLGVAYKTVANSCSRLKDKLGLARTADLIRLAIENSRK